MTKKCVLRLSTLVLSLCFSTASAQDACQEIARHGIHDVATKDIKTSTVTSYFNWFCDENFSNSNQADSFGAAIGIPFEGIPVKLGFDGQQESWQSWYRKFCAETRSDAAFQNESHSFVSKANASVLKAFRTCLEAPGLHVWLERTSDARVIHFAAQLKPDSRQSVVTIEVSPSRNVKCGAFKREIDASTTGLALILITRPLGLGNAGGRA